MRSARASVLGCEIDRLDLERTVARCAEHVEQRSGALQVSVNAAKLVAMRKDAALRDFVERSDIVSADGQSVVWASRLLGDPLPERVAGIDLMHRLLALAETRGYRVFVLGARRDVLERAFVELRRRHPSLVVTGRDGYFRDSEVDDVRAEIRAAEPDVLLVAMSSPQKERWLDDHARELGIPFAMGVGGAIDVVAGVVSRAPRWMQSAGLEWLYRLLQEPRRMWRRYLTTNVAFSLLLLRELAARRLQPRRPSTEKGTL
jgi:N-acetylglucosaminyldiphosphoundecaprenol N-acetyl-beta-D-mannosaminyltransferase